MLSVIVINFRSSPLVNDCLRALLSGSSTPDQIVVVDNEAIDGGLESELLGDPRIRLELRADNPGYAASCNTGSRIADGDVLLFLNADVNVDPATLQRCLTALTADAAVGIVTPRLVRLDGSLDHACHRGLPTAGASLAYKLGLERIFPFSHRLARYTMAWLDPTTDHDVEACSGAFLLIARNDLEAAGGWDERYRFYAEDLDLCLRVRDSGLRVRYLGTVKATHLKGAFSHYGTPDEELDPAQHQIKRRVQREVIASHRLFFEEHISERSMAPTRFAVELMFSMQARRLDAAERRVRS